MNNARFATQIHILTLLAKSPNQWLNSDWIAESIGINPVVVRRELSVLQKSGWVVGKKGKDGGAMLQVSAADITMADIYQAVKNSNVLGRKNTCRNTQCAIGREINKELDVLFQKTDAFVTDMLRFETLQAFADRFA